MVEGVVEFDGVEGFGVEFEPVGFGEVFGVKSTRPVPVMPAGSTNTDLGKFFPHKNILPNETIID